MACAPQTDQGVDCFRGWHPIFTICQTQKRGLQSSGTRCLNRILGYKAIANEEKITAEFSLHSFKERIASTQMFMKLVERMHVRKKFLIAYFNSRFHCTFNDTERKTLSKLSKLFLNQALQQECKHYPKLTTWANATWCFISTLCPSKQYNFLLAHLVFWLFIDT